ncbi:hypothetical protein GCM10022409_26000 [Hymenobacter glaciei]|uniref:Uncharacterized protein n=1 Tax=Hymenobacter glaciei TaxID=877209 RepID=A0ABP7UB28_9BACT
MQGAYSTYFDNLFLSLRMARPEYKAQAQYTLRTLREAALGAAFTPLLAELETAIAGFDENLTDRNQSTAGGTEAFHAARAKWLEFVDDTMKDYVTPKLRKLPVYADFKKFGKSKLAGRNQPKLLTDSKLLLNLYVANQAALYPTLGADAQQLYAALDAADETRDTQDGDITDAQLALADDRAAIARAQHRLKAQLELKFEQPEKVYSFFDFAKAEYARKAQKKAAKKAAAAPDLSAPAS